MEKRENLPGEKGEPARRKGRTCQEEREILPGGKGVKHVIEKQNGRWEEEEESLAESIEEYREDFETDSEIKTEI